MPAAEQPTPRVPEGMCYARYNTPRGEAGYAVEDVCHEDGCEEQIDRGLTYLCGEQPGVAADGACGRWFCVDHLYLKPGGEGQRCGDCGGAR
ncbi:MAG TPA: hypothetical protein VGO16_08545 [Pseudonocardiaceae bacterium]|nr:hypothetical protein [Pseudonocardiaceae bacterium]